MDLYKEFLYLKDQSNIWRKAKQREFNSLDQIILALSNIETLTLRNAMTLRMLGFVEKAGETSTDEVVLTSAGEILLKSPYKQQVLDEQLLKVYLDSDINPKLTISIFPLAIIFKFLMEYRSLSFEEYSLFICWINDNNDKEVALRLLRGYRDSSSETKQLYQAILAQKTIELGYSDFQDNIYRLFNMYKLSSFLDISSGETRWGDVLIANSTHGTYNALISALNTLQITLYHDQDTKIINIINVVPDHTDISNDMASLSADEQRLIKKQLTERNKLPDITEVEPFQVSAHFLTVQSNATKQTHTSSKPKKIDHDERGRRNRLVGAYGERIVVKYEYNKLIKLGDFSRASKIEHCSLTDDSLGYDVKSFTQDGREKHIEVKTITGKPKSFRFYISKNELDKVEHDPDHCIYIVINYTSLQPEILEIGNLSSLIQNGTATLSPSNYIVSVNLDYNI